ncbi:MAG: peptidoglycan-binding protein [Spirochaetia bacterium]|nr:peptidoglycan-binding protein [Spirochaetia bacterium]
MKKVDDSETMKIIPAQEPTGDWAVVDKWLYEKHVNDRYFTAIILEHDDLDLKPIIRFGSLGDDVKNVQTLIGVGNDGDFGQTTHSYLKMYQRKNKMNATEGVWEIPDK